MVLPIMFSCNFLPVEKPLRLSGSYKPQAALNLRFVLPPGIPRDLQIAKKAHQFSRHITYHCPLGKTSVSHYALSLRRSRRRTTALAGRFIAFGTLAVPVTRVRRGRGGLSDDFTAFQDALQSAYGRPLSHPPSGNPPGPGSARGLFGSARIRIAPCPQAWSSITASVRTRHSTMARPIGLTPPAREAGH
jgi:hypothetical protein